MSGLIWIQTVLHSDGIPERLILKKKISRRQERMQNYEVGKELSNQYKIGTMSLYVICGIKGLRTMIV